MKAAVTQETDAHNNFKKKKGVEGEHASSSQKFVLPKDPPRVELSSTVSHQNPSMTSVTESVRYSRPWH